MADPTSADQNPEASAAKETTSGGSGGMGLAASVPNYLQDLPVQVDVILGSLKLSIKELMNCGPGSVIDVGKKVTEPFDLYVNHNLVARGEMVMIHDRLGLKIVEVIEGGKNEK